MMGRKLKLSFHMTLPNILTAFRLLCLPFLIYELLEGQYVIALVLFCLAGISDFLDGFIARRFSLASRVGALLDPLVDKLLVVSTLVYFMWQGMVPLWFLLIILFRDFGQAVGLAILKKNKISFDHKSQVSGKLSTMGNFLVILVIILSYFYSDLALYYDWFFYGATLLTLFNIVHYSMLWTRIYTHQS